MVDPNGKVLIPVEYEDIESGVSLNLDWLWAKKDGKYGYLDENGAVVIPFIYDGAKTFSGLMAAVKKGDKWGFINRDFINRDAEEELPFWDNFENKL